VKIWIFDDSFNKKGPVLVILVPGMIQLKVTLFLIVRFIFSSPNLKTFIFQKAILSLKFIFPANNFKQQIQISSSG
jgi:hypothetical protein